MNESTTPQVPAPKKKKMSGCLKAFLIVFGLFTFIGLIGTLVNPDDDEKKTDETKNKVKVEERKDDKTVLHEDMVYQIDLMKNFERGDKSYLYILGLITTNRDLKIKTEVWGSDSTKVLLENELRKEAVKFQKKWLPVIRKEFVDDTRKKMWEHDIKVECEGAGCRDITFIGGMFAANRNIKDAYEGIQEALLNMRFRRANFKWIPSASEWDYYTVSTSGDGEF